MFRKLKEKESKRESQDFLEKKIEAAIDHLNKKSLLDAFEKGKSNYIFFTRNDDPIAIFGLGIPLLLRNKTAKSRLPNKNDMTDLNAKDVLKKFLLSAGNNNTYSLKFSVVAALLNLSEYDTGGRSFHYKKADEIINMVLAQLGHKVEESNNQIFANTP